MSLLLNIVQIYWRKISIFYVNFTNFKPAAAEKVADQEMYKKACFPQKQIRRCNYWTWCKKNLFHAFLFSRHRNKASVKLVVFTIESKSREPMVVIVVVHSIRWQTAVRIYNITNKRVCGRQHLHTHVCANMCTDNVRFLSLLPHIYTQTEAKKHDGMLLNGCTDGLSSARPTTVCGPSVRTLSLRQPVSRRRQTGFQRH